MRKIKIMVMKKIISRFRGVFNWSGKLAGKAVIAGGFFAVGVMVVMATEWTANLPTDKGAQSRLTTDNWNQNADMVNQLWTRVASLEGNQLPVCTSGQVLGMTESGWACEDGASGVVSYEDLPVGAVAGNCWAGACDSAILPALCTDHICYCVEGWNRVQLRNDPGTYRSGVSSAGTCVRSGQFEAEDVRIREFRKKEQL